MSEMRDSIRNWIMQSLFILILKKKDSVQPCKPVAFVNIPVKTTSRIKALSHANKQIFFWVIILLR